MALSARHLVAVALGMLLVSSPALADKDKHHGDKHHGDKHHKWEHRKHHKHGHHDRHHDHHGPVVIYEPPPRHYYQPRPVIVERGVVPVYPRVERRVVYDYFAVEPYAPVGLPPGIAKKIRKGYPLPAEVVYQPVPVALVERVPACMNGWQCIMAGADMLILDAVHGTVHDIIRGVVR